MTNKPVLTRRDPFSDFETRIAKTIVPGQRISLTYTKGESEDCTDEGVAELASELRFARAPASLLNEIAREFERSNVTGAVFESAGPFHGITDIRVDSPNPAFDPPEWKRLRGIVEKIAEGIRLAAKSPQLSDEERRLLAPAGAVLEDGIRRAGEVLRSVLDKFAFFEHRLRERIGDSARCYFERTHGDECTCRTSLMDAAARASSLRVMRASEDVLDQIIMVVGDGHDPCRAVLDGIPGRETPVFVLVDTNDR